jgi:hypothetical protein
MNKKLVISLTQLGKQRGRTPGFNLFGFKAAFCPSMQRDFFTPVKARDLSKQKFKRNIHGPKKDR